MKDIDSDVTQSARLVLSTWNATVYGESQMDRLLPELILYSLLYDEVLIPAKDLVTNRAITTHLLVPANRRVFQELLTSGSVKIVTRPPASYEGTDVIVSPSAQPLTARAAFHVRHRSYLGQPWQPTNEEWGLFERLDRDVTAAEGCVEYPSSGSDEHVFRRKLGKILNNRHENGILTVPVFGDISEGLAKAFIKFCEEPAARTFASGPRRQRVVDAVERFVAGS